MERKVGEIFEYNGEWYQCVVAIQGCRECSFRTHDYCTRHLECLSDTRSDKTSVIFKKLEKVGEPYSCNYYGDNRLIMMQEYNLFKLDDVTNEDKIPMYITDYKHKRIAIEIKQTKEDMEEKKLNLKPFDLQKAREGKPVCTRDGRKARIICFDRVGDFPIVALTDDREYKEEGVNLYDINGKGSNECFDLMMLPEKKEGYVNIVKEAYSDDKVVLGHIFGSYEDAVRSGKVNERYIATVKIQWEE